MEYLAVVQNCFLEHPGGAPRVAWDLALAMRDRGHAVTLLCYRDRPEDALGETVQEGIRVVRYDKDDRPGWHPGRLQAIVTATRDACRQWLGGRRFDCVHIHSPLQGLGAMEALGPGREGTGPRYVVTVHSPLVLEQEIMWRSQGWTGRLKLMLGRRLLKEAEAKLLRDAAVIHVLSRYTRRELETAYGVGDRIQVLPHWYARQVQTMDRAVARQALGWDAEAKIFFTVRALGPRYGLELAIRALAPLVRQYDCRCYLAGSGSLKAGLEALIASLGVQDRIRLLGRISDADLERAYAAADLFLLPTLALECFGLITIESLAFGCPVLASDAGAIPESLEPVLPGYLVRAGDEGAFREKARAFLEGRLPVPERARLMDYAAQNFSRAAVEPQLVALFGSGS